MIDLAQLGAVVEDGNRALARLANAIDVARAAHSDAAEIAGRRVRLAVRDAVEVLHRVLEETTRSFADDNGAASDGP